MARATCCSPRWCLGCGTGFLKWWLHLFVMLRKNWWLSLRNRRALLLQIMVPFLLVFFLFLIQLALRTTDGEFGRVRKTGREVNNEKVPRCVDGFKRPDCYTIVYAPAGDADVEAVMELLRESEDIPRRELRGFENGTVLDDWLYRHVNVSQSALLFSVAPDAVTGVKNIEYVLQFNKTDTDSYGRPIMHQTYVNLPMLVAVEKAILRHISGNAALEYNIDRGLFPHTDFRRTEVIGTFGPLFFFGALMFNFVAALNQLVSEKESRLRESLRVMGLADSVFWCSWFITSFVLSTMSALVLIISGLIFQFSFFLVNNFLLYFLLIWLFAMTLIPLSFLVSTLVQKTSQAVAIGFLFFVVGFIVQVASYLIFSDRISIVVQVLLALLSPSIFAKGLYDFGTYSANSDSEGLQFSNWADYTDNFPLPAIYVMLIFDFFLYLVLALYFDNVLPSPTGTRRPLWFCCLPSYWTGRSRPKRLRNHTPPHRNNPDDDVVAEERATLLEAEAAGRGDRSADADPERELDADGMGDDGTAVRIVKLRKEYGVFRKFVAVDDMCLRMENNKVFCLLGENGAGKTTTISMLTGLYRPSGGDATIFGNSVQSGMDEIRKLTGICPQFDMQWPELTAWEHLWLLSILKGVPLRRVKAEIAERLAQVELTGVRNARSSSYSGGMRRRLSVAIAFIGNPKIVFIDEGTTGMDPISRRQVWDVIERSKKGRCIVLTTHSMEEADVLGDRIAITALGRIRCLGTSLHLKNKFGAGYRLVMHVDPARSDDVAAFVTEQAPAAALVSNVFGYMSFDMPIASGDALPRFFTALERQKDALGIADVQISQTTLEDVFLSVAERVHTYQNAKDKQLRLDKAQRRRSRLHRVLPCVRKDVPAAAADSDDADELLLTEKEQQALADAEVREHQLNVEPDDAAAAATPHRHSAAAAAATGTAWSSEGDSSRSDDKY